MSHLNRELIEQQLSALPLAQYGWIETAELEFSERIRRVCEQECPMYGKTWACPPAVGTVEECRARCLSYPHALYLTTLTEVSDIANLDETLATRAPHEAVTREALAIELLEREQDRYDSIVKLSELLARLAPMLGLLGTLIPLGPGIIALGQGDTYTLSTSLLTAFDTTIAGLVAAALAIVVSAIRRRWYREYGSVLEALCTEVLELTKKGEA